MKETEKEKERPEHIVCVKFLGTYISTSERERRMSEYFAIFDVLYMKMFLITADRSRKGEARKYCVVK